MQQSSSPLSLYPPTLAPALGGRRSQGQHLSKQQGEESQRGRLLQNLHCGEGRWDRDSQDPKPGHITWAIKSSAPSSPTTLGILSQFSNSYNRHLKVLIHLVTFSAQFSEDFQIFTVRQNSSCKLSAISSDILWNIFHSFFFWKFHNIFFTVRQQHFQHIIFTLAGLEHKWALENKTRIHGAINSLSKMPRQENHRQKQPV